MPALAADGCHVTTVEGVGSVKGGLHPVQQAMVDMHGSQCGMYAPLHWTALQSDSLLSLPLYLISLYMCRLFFHRLLYTWYHRFTLHFDLQKPFGLLSGGTLGWKPLSLHWLSTHLGCCKVAL